MFKGNTETYSTLTGFLYQPLNFLINDTWNNIFVIHNSYLNNKFWGKVYTFGIKESAKVDLEAHKGQKAIVGSSVNCYADGSNFLTLGYNDRDLVEANWFGQINFENSGLDNEYYSLYDYKDVGLYNNRIIWL